MTEKFGRRLKHRSLPVNVWNFIMCISSVSAESACQWLWPPLQIPRCRCADLYYKNPGSCIPSSHWFYTSGRESCSWHICLWCCCYQDITNSVYMFVHTDRERKTHAHTHVHMNTTHTHTLTRTHARTHARTHTNMHTCMHSCFSAKFTHTHRPAVILERLHGTVDFFYSGCFVCTDTVVFWRSTVVLGDGRYSGVLNGYCSIRWWWIDTVVFWRGTVVLMDRFSGVLEWYCGVDWWWIDTVVFWRGTVLLDDDG